MRTRKNSDHSNDERKLGAVTGNLLSVKENELTKRESVKLLEDLKEVIRYHDHRYYLLNDPVISDYEYDRLFRLLKFIEKKWPELRTADSPTQRIPGGISKEFPKVKHLTPMLSLESSYNQKDLIEFDNRVKTHIVSSEIQYILEPKFDGTGISLVYENDLLLRGATRGDGVAGEDITTNLKLLRSIPLKADFSSYGIYKIELRGEVLMTKETLKELNNQRQQEGLPLFANPRNAAAGSLRLQDTQQLAARPLEAFVYQISFAVNKNNKDLLKTRLSKHFDNIALLHNLGFNSPYADIRKSDRIQEILDYCLEMERDRDKRAYEIDGAVIKINDLNTSLKLGYTSHHPRWAIAFKFKPRQATTILKDVQFHVGKSGIVTPVAKLDPVSLSGVVISSATLHNEAFIKANDLHYGDTVLIERAGDVIPYIVKPIVESRPASAKKITFPARCPSCHSKLHKEPEEAAWRCLNINCPAQVVERLKHFCRTMDIEGLGESTVYLFYKNGFIKKIPDIFHLPYDDIRKMEGFGEKSVNNLRQAIENSKQKPIDRLLAGLGIPYIGWNTAAILAKSIKNITQLYNCSAEQLTRIQGIGNKAADAICRFFRDPENIDTLERLRKAGVNIASHKLRSPVRKTLSGMSFAFTGQLEHYTRQKAKTVVEELGGEVKETVSKGLTYLVAGSAPGSKLDRAKKNATKIINEKDFIKIISKKSG